MIRKLNHSLVIACLLGVAPSGGAEIGTAFNYQGFLESGIPPAPVNGSCDFRFGLWKDASSILPADQVGSLQTLAGLSVDDGVFAATMDFGAGAIDGSARWLEIEVCCASPCAPGALVTLSPRVELKPTPHALALPGVYTVQEPAAVAGISPPPKLAIRRISGGTGVAGVTGAVSIEALDGAGAAGLQLKSGVDPVMSYDPAVGEAVFEALNGVRAGSVKIDSSLASNAAGPGSSAELVVTGDVLALKVDGETVDRWTGLVNGGALGFTPNRISGSPLNSVAAGKFGAVIGGGGSDVYVNQVTANLGTIGGGQGNTAGGNGSTVGGGGQNTASGHASTVAGGSNNVASGLYSTVGGGIQNTASAQNSTTPGGEFNVAGGNYSFAAGRRAKANHLGAFVWADVTDADFTSTGSNQFLIRADGGVGIGTAAPTTTLEVRESSLPGGWPVVITSNLQAGINLKTDGQASSWAIYHDAGDSLVFRDSTTGANRMIIDGGAGTVSMISAATTVAVVNRLTNDGTLISLQQASTEEGTISVSGTTVSYNAFTGSHYGWTDESISRGTLVTLTGDNRRRSENPGSEPTYGIAPSNKANDSKCLGAYLGLLEPSKAAAMENPHQIMAVGNGDMWVVDTGRNIEPGQYLISSDLKGHAMPDDEARFPVGYVIARAAEPVDWSAVTEMIHAHKHKRISVFFESFERGSSVGLGKIVEQQQTRIEDLSKRLSGLEASKLTQSSLTTASIVCFGLGAMTFGGRTLRRRRVRGGVQ